MFSCCPIKTTSGDSAHQCEKMFCIAMWTGGQAFGFSYLHLDPPQKMAHCIDCGVNFRKFSENLLYPA